MDQFLKAAFRFLGSKRHKKKETSEQSEGESKNSLSENEPAVNKIMNETENDEKEGKERSERRLFVGGLNYSTTSKGLETYFSCFGKVIDCVVMSCPKTGKSRGFGFVTFENLSDAEKVLHNSVHVLDGKKLQCRPSTCKDDSKPKTEKRERVFLGGLPLTITKEELKQFFSRYGEVTDVIIPVDRKTKAAKGFGFLEFKDEHAADKCLGERFVYLNERRIFINRADPRNKKRVAQEHYDSTDSELSLPKDSATMCDADTQSTASGEKLLEFNQDQELRQLLQNYLLEKITSYEKLYKKKVENNKSQRPVVDSEEMEDLLKDLLINSDKDLIQFSDEEYDESDTSDNSSDEDDYGDKENHQGEFDKKLLKFLGVESRSKPLSGKDLKYIDHENVDETLQGSPSTFRIRDASGILVCSLCQWTSPDQSCETFLAHCKTPAHRTKLKERFPASQVQENIPESKLCVNSEDLKDKQYQSEPLVRKTQEDSGTENGSQDAQLLGTEHEGLSHLELRQQMSEVLEQQRLIMQYLQRNQQKQISEEAQKQKVKLRQLIEENQLMEEDKQRYRKKKESKKEQETMNSEQETKTMNKKQEKMNLDVLKAAETEKQKKKKEKKAENKNFQDEQKISKLEMQKVNNTPLKLHALAKGMACIQALSEKKLSCTMCEKVIPEASDLDILMKNITQHLQSKKHLNNLLKTEESLKNLLSKTQEERKTPDLKNKNSSVKNEKGKNITSEKAKISNQKSTGKASVEEKATTTVTNVPKGKDPKPQTVRTEQGNSAGVKKSEKSGLTRGVYLCLQCNFYNADIEIFGRHLKSKLHSGNSASEFLKTDVCDFPECQFCHSYLCGSLYEINLHFSKCSSKKS